MRGDTFQPSRVAAERLFCKPSPDPMSRSSHSAKNRLKQQICVLSKVVNLPI